MANTFALNGTAYRTDSDTLGVLRSIVPSAKARSDSSAVIAVLELGLASGRIVELRIDDMSAHMRERLATLGARAKADRETLLSRHLNGDAYARDAAIKAGRLIGEYQQLTSDYRVRTMPRDATIEALAASEAIFERYLETVEGVRS